MNPDTFETSAKVNELEVRARERIANFLHKKTVVEAIAEIKIDIRNFDATEHVDLDKIYANLDLLVDSEREIFTERAIEVMRPIIDLYVNHPREYERIKRIGELFQADKVMVNDMLYYNIEDSTLMLHIASHIHSSDSEKMFLFRSGLKKLAEVIQSDDNIKKISATSWIVAERKKLLELLGFTIVRELGDEERKEHFPGEDRPVAEAVISRDQFISRFLKE